MCPNTAGLFNSFISPKTKAKVKGFGADEGPDISSHFPAVYKFCWTNMDIDLSNK
jgi:hypothetical protein